MDKQKKIIINKSLVIQDSGYKNISSSSADHYVVNKKNECPIYKYRRFEIPSIDISSLDSGELSIFLNLRKQQPHHILLPIFFYYIKYKIKFVKQRSYMLIL